MRISRPPPPPVYVAPEEPPQAATWWRLVRGTFYGTVDLAKGWGVEAKFQFGVARTKARSAVDRYKAERSWSADDQPDPDEIPGKRWEPVSYACFACGRKWRSSFALNRHFEMVHEHDVPAWLDEMTKPVPLAPRSRKGRRVRRKPKTKRQAAVARAVATAKSTIGVRAMASGFLKRIADGWREVGDARPVKLSEIREDLIGLEQLHATVVVEAVAGYRRRLIQMGFDPAQLQNLARGSDALAAASRHFSATVAVIEEALKDEIALAKARKGASKPSDDVLAG